MTATFIVNPVAGGGRADPTGERRAARASRRLRHHGIDARTLVTRAPGHASELARHAAADGTDLVFACGGDGTLNEVASALAFSKTPMAVVRGGSGNGLAASLGVPRRLEAAIDRALAAPIRIIDAGELGGRLFFNVAGVGFDAHVAALFDANPGPRGFRTYLRLALRELPRARPLACRVSVVETAGRDAEVSAAPDQACSLVDLIALANGPDYGNGARIAPGARLDDGALDLVTVNARSYPVNLWRATRVMARRFEAAPGVTIRRVTSVAIASDDPIPFHVDGEPVVGSTTIVGRIRPQALRVRA